ncbi:MAG: fibrillarin-like rRNA/tRNA 2'-O-methyltransferase [Nanoarchaeota archaeon]|nr:fibrillarin-like rRNA/tRNA 2'-O-methyltransferase [Nanoarchaeota archaeon]
MSPNARIGARRGERRTNGRGQARRPNKDEQKKEGGNFGRTEQSRLPEQQKEWSMQPHHVFELYQKGRHLFTKNLLPGKAPFAEQLVRDKGEEYRQMDPRRSKLSALVHKGCTNVGIRTGNIVLYLGVSHGYTASFVSDMIGPDGLLFGIDPAPRVMRDFVFLAEERKNMAPMLADANHPEEYISRVCLADVVYQDIAQRNQAEIFIKNCQLFLKKDGYGLLAVKARSIDVTKRPKVLFEDVRRQLEKVFTVIDFRILEPEQRDHCMIVVKK